MASISSFIMLDRSVFKHWNKLNWDPNWIQSKSRIRTWRIRIRPGRKNTNLSLANIWTEVATLQLSSGKCHHADPRLLKWIYIVFWLLVTIRITGCEWEGAWNHEKGGGRWEIKKKKHRGNEGREEKKIYRNARRAGRRREKLSYLRCNRGKGAFADWSCHGNGWHLVYVRVALCMIVFVCGGFCVCECASEHLEVFVSVCACVCV